VATILRIVPMPTVVWMAMIRRKTHDLLLRTQTSLAISRPNFNYALIIITELQNIKAID
jgi:ABC-type dipeptide/oligopeptide/nickel transport system permease component